MKKRIIHYRQGDVLIERIPTIPTTAKAQKRSKAIILAHGEVTGHHHVLEPLASAYNVCDSTESAASSCAADWWKNGEIAPTLEKPSTLAGEIFISLPHGGTVKHPEHSRIKLPAGNYRVMRQREYSPQAIRNVRD